MKTIRELMTSDVVWISPSARVKTAVVLMKGHKIGALPVVQSDEVVGLLTQLAVLGAPPDAVVSDVMDTDFLVAQPDTPVSDAAEMMNMSAACCILAMENGRLVGMVTRSDLMPELGKNFDPLTDLPWSDALREWAMRALKHGIEISVILFDLDKFGQYNKKHGHVIGDAVIKEAAKVLKAGTNPEIDLVCRYGGDEFGIVTSRNRDEAVLLADSLKAQIGQIRIPGVPEGVSGTYGIFGGRRTKEREDIHYAATIDDLITRASKNCIASKPGRAEEATAAPQPPAQPAPPAPKPAVRLKIKSVTISTTETEVKAGVTLSQGDREFHGEAEGYSSGGGASMRVVAEAAAKAACESLEPGNAVVVEGVTTHRVGTEDEVVSVTTTFIGPRLNVRHVGSALVRRGDHHRTAVAALLSSVNRLIEPRED